MFQSSLYLLLILAGFLRPICDKGVLLGLCVCVVSPDCVRTHCTNLLLNDVATIFVCVPLIVSVMSLCYCLCPWACSDMGICVAFVCLYVCPQNCLLLCLSACTFRYTGGRAAICLRTLREEAKMGSLVCRHFKACVASWLAGWLTGWVTIPWGQADLRFDYKPNNMSFIFAMWMVLITQLDKWFS